MERSLSVLLPVHNAQATLAQRVGELLDVLPDLTGRFELVIIDDGSSDATIEVADELAAAYPQVRVIRHGSSRGRQATVLSGLQRSCGDVVFLEDEGCTLAPDDMVRLWRVMDRHELVLGRPRTVPQPYVSRWRVSERASTRPGCQMAHRQVVGPLAEALADQAALRDRLQELGYRWHEVEFPEHRSTSSPTLVRSRSRETSTDRPECLNAREFGHGEGGRPKVPNYLNKLRRFALGE